MPSNGSIPEWWDWTSFAKDEPDMMDEVRSLTPDDLLNLSRDGFRVMMYDTAQDFFLAEALEYVRVFQRSTSANPLGVCGPVGPTEQLPLVAEIINSLGIDATDAHFAGMDEFAIDGKPVPYDHPLSFERTDMEMCFNRIETIWRPYADNLHFPSDLDDYVRAWNDEGISWELTQGGQGDTKHFAFDDPLRAIGIWALRPPTVEEYKVLPTRLVELHPLTLAQDARHSNGGEVSGIPNHAFTVGPKEVLGRSKCISIWHPGHHDNAFGIRLTAYMISKKIVDARVPMSLLGLHDNVIFSYLRPCIGKTGVDMK